MAFIRDLVVIIVYTLILSGNAVTWPGWQDRVDGEMDGLDAGPPWGTCGVVVGYREFEDVGI